jgi:hypothetical protein
MVDSTETDRFRSAVSGGAMLLVAMLATAAFVVVGAVVGARMLRIALRTRQLPELYLGGSLFLYAAVGQPFVVASRPLGGAFGFEVRLFAVALGLAAIISSVLALYLFTWHVFRADSKWAEPLVWLAACAAILSGTVVLATIPSTPGIVTLGMKLGIGCLSLVFAIGMGWTGWESFRYHGMMRRRLALGLADPVVVNRFLLWGSGCAITGLTALAMIGCVGAGFNVANHPAPLMLTSVAGTFIAGCWYLTFLPPASYLRWIGGETAAQEA